MNIHEYQAKQLFAQFGIPVPKGKDVRTPLGAEKWSTTLDSPVYVGKAQIHAGGAGEAGGGQLTEGRPERPGPARGVPADALGTHQTRPTGREGRALRV